MIFAEHCWHKQIYVKTHHILPGVTQPLTNVLSQLFYTTSILHQINVNYTAVRSYTLPLRLQ